MCRGLSKTNKSEDFFYAPSVVSVSIAGSPAEFSQSNTFSYFENMGIPIVQAAPNVSQGSYDWGSTYEDVVNVGAWNTATNGELLLSSINTLGTVDVVANGYVTNPSWGSNFGTSFATPRVAAEITNNLNNFLQDLAYFGSDLDYLGAKLDLKDVNNYSDLVSLTLQDISTTIEFTIAGDSVSYFVTDLLTDDLLNSGTLPLTVPFTSTGLAGIIVSGSDIAQQISIDVNKAQAATSSKSNDYVEVTGTVSGGAAGGKINLVVANSTFSSLLDEKLSFSFKIEKTDLANGLFASKLEYSTDEAPISSDWFLISNDLERFGYETFSGDDTSNTFYSTSGNEKFVGGLGADTFEFSKSNLFLHGKNKIADFNVNEDQLVLNGFSYSDILRTLDEIGSSHLTLEQSSDGRSELSIESPDQPSLIVIKNLSGASLKFSGERDTVLTITSEGSISTPTNIHFESVQIDSITDLETQLGKVGDLSASDPIDISDVVTQLRDIVGLSKLSGNSKHAADVNNDGEVNISDVVGNLRHIVGLDKLNSFDLVTDAGVAINSLQSSSIGNLHLVVNGDADQSHAELFLI